MSDLWAKLEGHTVNGVLPLRRYLGGSNHSVVFLTESAQLGRSELALKLVPAVPALAQLQMARWRASAGLVHPHLIQIFEAGQCQIGERHFLYVVTDYADQNLAQLLERRALTEDEAREMLAPTLESLAFLHDKKLVQGRLKPSNVLVVGDQIKLASDTIRPFSETGRAANVASAYMPPEAREGVRTGASDVWALGVTLSEALTRQQPTGLLAGDMLLPPAMSSTFRGVVARCLSRRARDRPTVSELQVWARGAKLVASLSASGTHKLLPDAASRDAAIEVLSESTVERPAGRADERSPGQGGGGVRTSAPPKLSMGLVLVVIVAAFALFVMGWAAVRAPDSRPAPAVPDEVVEASAPPAAAWVRTASESRAGIAAPVMSSDASLPPSATVVSRATSPPSARLSSSATSLPNARLASSATVPSGAAMSSHSSLPSGASSSSGTAIDPALSAVLNEVIPQASQRARQSIRGRVRVSVRLIVDKEGKVFAALVDEPGPSRYFEKLALDAAEKWTFAPSPTGTERLMLVRFDFSRQGTTVRAEPVK